MILPQLFFIIGRWNFLLSSAGSIRNEQAGFDFVDLRKLDMATLKRYTSPQAVKDFDRFLDALPLNVGYNALIAAGLTCVMGGAAVWFAAGETEKVSKLHSDLMNVQALQPPVPVLKYTAISHEALEPLLKEITQVYKGVAVTQSGNGGVTVTAQDTDYFPQFLAAIGYIQRGGENWKVKIDALCVGRECSGPQLSAKLKIEMVGFANPEIKSEDELKSESEKK
jgi:hypothetical protein